MKVVLIIGLTMFVCVNLALMFLIWSNTADDEKEAATAVFLKTRFIEGDTGRGFAVAKGAKLFGWVKDGYFYFERVYEIGEGVTYRVKIDETIQILK